MAFLRNGVVNRVNLHYGIRALANGVGGVFFLAYLLHVGVSVPLALACMAGILAGRFTVRPILLPMAKRWGLRPLVIAGGLITALQYPLLAEVRGAGPWLAAACAVGSLGDTFYWPSYHAYFASLGDAEHRGHQIGAREVMAAAIGVAAPLLGAWALTTAGPRWTFAGVGLVEALSVLPLIGAPNVTPRREAPGGYRAARLGMMLFVSDGWLSACFYMVWQVALFVAVRRSLAAYGGAMALAALVGAVAGAALGQRIDLGHGRRAAALAYVVAAAVVTLRAVSVGLPWLAVAANALGALALTMIVPAMMTAVYNLAKASPCAFRFHMASEGAWDVGCGSACLLAACLAAKGVPLSAVILLALPSTALTGVLLWRHYGEPGAALAVQSHERPRHTAA